MDIENILKEYEVVHKKQLELSAQIGEYYKPIVERLRREKDEIGLHHLLDKLPACMAKMMVYQALHEISSSL